MGKPARAKEVGRRSPEEIAPLAQLEFAEEAGNADLTSPEQRLIVDQGDSNRGDCRGHLGLALH